MWMLFQLITRFFEKAMKAILRVICGVFIFAEDNFDWEAENHDNNPYKTDLARIMGTLDDHEEGVATLNNTQFIRLIKQIGMSIQMGGPGVTRVQASIVEPLVRLYDSDVHTKDIRIACLEVLSSMLLFQPNSQIEAKKAGLHVCILDDLEHFTYNLPAYGENGDDEFGRNSEGADTRNSMFSMIHRVDSMNRRIDEMNVTREHDNRVFVSWMVYTLKCMCMGNPEVKAEILRSVQNRDALVSMLRDAGNIAYWDSFTESGRDQSDELIKVLDLNIDSFAEKDENTDYDSDENDDNFGDEDEFEPKRATLTDRLSRGSGITKYNDNIDGSINFPVPQNNGKSSPIKLANQVQSKNSPAVSKSPVIKESRSL